MKQKSIKKNIVLNVIRVLTTVLFPLITFPYASRILGTDNMGKIQFSSTVITFFLLISAFGINSYAVREGSSLRENRKRISNFASNIFSINIIFTVLSYLLLFFVLLIPTKINLYYKLILIYSIQILFTTIGVEWIYIIYEDFLYITIRTIIIQIVSLVLLLIFVHEPNDIYLYALIIVISNTLVNIFNYFHSKKHVDLRFTFSNDFKNNIKPMMTLFSNDIAQQVYINSDSLMLGLMTSDYNVGIYSIAVKIYTVVKKLLNAVIAVTIPRMAYYNGNDENKFTDLCKKIFDVSVLLIIPLIVLLFLLSDKIVLILFDKEYIDSIIVVRILSVGLLFAVLANLFCNGVLIVKKQDKSVLNATIMAALVNVISNFIFINFYKEIGAAITTVLAELIVMLYTCIRSKKYVSFKINILNLFIEIIGCLGIVGIYLLLIRINITNNIIFAIMVSTIGIMFYMIIILLFKYKTVFNYLKNTVLKKV